MPKKAKTRRGKLTTADLAAASALRALMDKSPLTQDEIRKRYNSEGRHVSQGLISQYKNGKIKLGLAATMRFARVLEVEPRAIRPDLKDLKVLPGDLPPRVQRIAAELAMYNDDVLDDIEASIRAVREMGSSYAELLRKIRENATADSRVPADK